MTESRFKRRKLASREHAAETMLRESIRRQDLLFLDEIALAVIESETADHAGLALRYRQVGGWLLANYSRLDLRISVFELRDFAKRLAAELSDELRKEWFSSDSCWDWYWHTGSPFLIKRKPGKEPEEPSLRRIDLQEAVMVDIALIVWDRDAVFRAGAQALKRYHDAHIRFPPDLDTYIEE
jgi:hypothetical protein